VLCAQAAFWLGLRVEVLTSCCLCRLKVDDSAVSAYVDGGAWRVQVLRVQV
jgi:hypothetical protein